MMTLSGFLSSIGVFSCALTILRVDIAVAFVVAIAVAIAVASFLRELYCK